MNAHMDHYKSNSIMTASPEQILVMLFDGAIRFVRQARQAIADDRKADKAHAISKAMAIVTEFSNSLDHEVGGEIAADLNRLYDFMVRELVAVNAHSDVKRLDPVEKVLLNLREGFAEAAIIHRREQQAAQPIASPVSDQRSALAY